MRCWKDVHRAEAREFREDVIRVARGREPGVRIKDIAADFGMSESCPTNWRTQADRDQGVRAGPTGGRLTPVEYEMIMTSQATRAA